MNELFGEINNTKEEIKEFSVSEISFEIKKFVESTFGRVRVRGEIFGAKRADSGHWYLTLKDDNAALSAVVWRGVASTLAFKPEDGLEVVATGKITTFAGKSSYQLSIETMEAAGTGALLKLLEERKKKFAAEGLFDAAHKKKIPYLPGTIGVVTSASGAVIRDIIHRVQDRFPTHILLIPTPVQGEGAAEKIAQAIRDFNRIDQISDFEKPDVLIVARGGGSLEDLWPFNEECVVRAVYESEIPVISAVGHETDTMLIDFVADRRAPTPTGAAEFAVPVKAELELKKAAKAAGEKAVAMIKQRELLPLTGYVHGGCSPIGMKKQFPTFIHDSAKDQEKIFVSAGKVGFQIELSPSDLAATVGCGFADIICSK